MSGELIVTPPPSIVLIAQQRPAISIVVGGGSGAAVPAVAVEKAGTPIGTRGALNLIEGTGVTLGVADNPGNDSVDVTVNATASGDVVGPGSAVSGHLAVFSGTSGKLVADGGAVPTGNVVGPGSAVSGHVAVFSGATGKLVADGGVLPGSFAIATDIAPLHWYLGSQTTRSGGLVDSINDQGSLAKNFTQSGAPRCPVAVDGNGKTYLAPDGAADFYTAGAVADWAFLNNGAPWTIALVYQRAVIASALESILDTTDHTTGSTGIGLLYSFTSAAIQGPQFLMTSGAAGSSPVVAQSLLPSTALTVLILRFSGDNSQISAGGITPTAPDLQMRRQAALVNFCNKKNVYNVANPSFNMTLFRRANTADRFGAVRLYDMIIDNKAWSDRQVAGYEEYARTNYFVAI